MTDELQVPQPEPFKISEELRKVIDAALNKIKGRSFSGRNPELGKMFKCQACGLRHRGKQCEQVFTYKVKDYEYFREDENGLLVPDFRTAVRPDEKPTKRQVMGAAAFKKKRYHPHPSKIKLLLIEYTRAAFTAAGFPTERAENELPDDFKAAFEKNLQRARVLAARRIRRERELRDRDVRRHQDQSRRINAGLL
jgi:hypothetical protein